MVDPTLVRSWLTLAPLARFDDVALLAMHRDRCVHH